jgi:hypothetical protein
MARSCIYQAVASGLDVGKGPQNSRASEVLERRKKKVFEFHGGVNWNASFNGSCNSFQLRLLISLLEAAINLKF